MSMEDTFAISGADWEDCAAIPGWKIKADSVDCGQAFGVAIWNGVMGDGRRRCAVRMSAGKTIEDAIPLLEDWVLNP